MVKLVGGIALALLGGTWVISGVIELSSKGKSGGTLFLVLIGGSWRRAAFFWRTPA